MLEDGAHCFVVEVGSERGREVLAELPHRAGGERASARPPTARSSAPPRQMGRAHRHDRHQGPALPQLEHPRWDEVADRCLTCGNCTMVCPTCFCTTVEDMTDLDRRGRPSAASSWDSCFTVDFSYVHGGSVRSSGGRATASG